MELWSIDSRVMWATLNRIPRFEALVPCSLVNVPCELSRYVCIWLDAFWVLTQKFNAGCTFPFFTGYWFCPNLLCNLQLSGQGRGTSFSWTGQCEWKVTIGSRATWISVFLGLLGMGVNLFGKLYTYWVNSNPILSSFLLTFNILPNNSSSFQIFQKSSENSQRFTVPRFPTWSSHSFSIEWNLGEIFKEKCWNVRKQGVYLWGVVNKNLVLSTEFIM